MVDSDDTSRGELQKFMEDIKTPREAVKMLMRTREHLDALADGGEVTGRDIAMFETLLREVAIHGETHADEEEEEGEEQMILGTGQAVDKLKVQLTPDQFKLVLQMDEEFGSDLVATLTKVHDRLRSVLPRMFWPLLAIAFDPADDAWEAFEKEKVGEYPAYIAS